MEDPSLGKKCNTKDPHIWTVRQMLTDRFKSMLNDDSDESDILSHPVSSKNKITYVWNWSTSIQHNA
jgi:hypothetical protein